MLVPTCSRRTRWALSLLSLALLPSAARAAEKKLVVEGLASPESVAVAPDGRVFASIIGKSGTNGDGSIALIADGQATTYAKGLDDPKGLVAIGQDLYTADKTRVWKIDADGNATVFADAADFPIKPKFLNDIEAGPDGSLYVSDCGSFVADGVVFRITPKKEITAVITQKTAPSLKAPNGLLMDGKDAILVADFTTGDLYHGTLADGKLEKLAKGLGGADGIARDAKGRIYIGDWKAGRVLVLETPTAEPKVLAEGFKAAADLTYDAKHNVLLVPDSKGGTITSIAIE